jgi:hypothetical protein
MNATEWKLDLFFMLLVGLGLWLWLQQKRAVEILARLEDLRKLSRPIVVTKKG